MAAPKGNKYAKGNPNSGRPANYSDEELIEIGEDMVKWFETHEDAIFLQEYPLAKGYLNCDLPSDWSKTRQVFLRYYDKCRKICGLRQAKGAGKDTGLHASIANRFLGVYFKEVKEHDREMKEAKDSNTKEILTSLMDSYQVIKNDKPT